MRKAARVPCEPPIEKVRLRLNYKEAQRPRGRRRHTPERDFKRATIVSVPHRLRFELPFSPSFSRSNLGPLKTECIPCGIPGQ